jgi:hypothetical protein
VSEEFCVEHGTEWMRRKFGAPVAYCAICDELTRLRARAEKAERQAAGQCDGCGEQLGDAFCTCCVAKRCEQAEQERDAALAQVEAMKGAIEALIKRTPFQPAVGGISLLLSFEQMNELRVLLTKTQDRG